MKDKVAVATVSGKAYFLLINELKERNADFVSLKPGETVPAEVKAVLTTAKEKPLIKHEHIIVYDENQPPINVVNEALRVAQGKERYDKVVIGVDPGEVFGVAVVADGKVVEELNCFGLLEAKKGISDLVKSFNDSTEVKVKIGNGVPIYKELLESLDSDLPPEAVLEVVSEAGTDRPAKEGPHRRGLRDIASAIRIAARSGHVFPRGQETRRSREESGFEEAADFSG
jgi:hypothetical protein